MLKKIDVFKIIERIASLIRAEERKICSHLKLQYTHLQILNYLAICNKYSNSPATLAKYLGMTRGTVSQTLILLEKKGYLKKTVDVQDKRLIHLDLLPSGYQVLQQANLGVLFAQTNAQLTKNLEPEYEATVSNILTALQKANQSHSFGICKTCCYFTENNCRFVCGLTQEKLTHDDSEKICHEHNAA